MEQHAGAEPIAIVGMAARVPGAGDTDRYWHNLVHGVESLTWLTREQMAAAGADAEELDDPDLVPATFLLDDVAGFDAGLFGMTAREADVADPQHRVLLELCHSALEDAGYDPARYPGDIGVYAGRGTERYRWEHVHRNRALLDSVPQMAVGIGNLADNVSTLPSYRLDLRGPSISLFTACSTSLVAVHMATEALRAGECDMALAGGVSIEFPLERGSTHDEGGVVSADGHVRPFDAAATGTMWGSGGGVVLLKRLSDALADGDDVRAVVLGNAVNNDGSGKVGFTAPSVDGQAAVVATALSVAGVDPRTVSYVEAHGTATALGDPIEVAALSTVYGRGTGDRGWCGLGSVKGNIGHLSQGAGTAGLIKTVLSLRHGLVPPSLHFTAPNPAIDFADSPFYVNATLAKWEREATPRRAAVSSFGIGGTNAHVVLEEAPEREPAPAAPGPHLLLLSARTPRALDEAAERLAAHLAEHGELALADVAYTLRVGRAEHPHRRAVVAADPAAAVAGLRERKRPLTGQAPPTPPTVAFLFSGQGAQFAGMGAGLYAAEPRFAAVVDECAEILTAELGEDLRPLLLATGADRAAADARLGRTALTQPALFTVEYALAELWRSWGVRPTAMIGHSIGEYVAATVAGVFTLPDALRLVATRGRLMQEMPPGAMLAVTRGEAEVAPLLPADVSIATVNGPGTCVVAGPTGAVDAVAADLSGRGIASKRLRTSHAFHSVLMEPVLAPYAAAVAAVPRQAPTLAWLSNVTGEPVTAAQATDPAYWTAQLRQPVRFADCVARVLADGPVALVECGPGRQLAGLARMQVPKGALPPQPSLPGPTDRGGDAETLLGTAGRLWTVGVPVTVPAPGRRVPLPVYPYQRDRHWVDADPAAAVATPAADADADAVPDRLPAEEWFAVPAWRQLPAVLRRSPLDRAMVLSADERGAAVVAALREHGTDVVEVVPGPAYGRESGRFTVRPDRPEDLAAVVREVGEVRRAVHAWPLAGDPATDADSTWAALDRGLVALLHLVQALVAADAVEDVRIDVLTAGTQAVLGGDLVRPEHATVAGIVRSVPLELPGIRLRHLDADPDAPPAGLAAALVGEVLAETGPELVALRAGRRWALGHEQLAVPEPATPTAGLREGGRYLVTGGLGGLGRTVAADLARLRAKLVLIGRSAPSPAAAAAVRAMEEAGAEVLVLAADVTDPAALARVRASALERFGGLDGIVHSAGIAAGGLVETRDRAAMRPVLAPKVAGELALREVFGADELDLVVLFSSVTGTTGGLGEVEYCAANAYLDAVALGGAGWRARVLSIGWGGWREVGMLADLLAGAPGRVLDHPLLTRLRDGRDAAGTVTATGTLSPERDWVLAEHRVGGVPVLPATGQLEAMRAAATAGLPRPSDEAVLELTDVLFLEPLAVPDGTSAQLEVTVRPTGDDRAEVTLSGVDGREYGRGTAGWTVVPVPPALDLDAVRARCPARPDLLAATAGRAGGLLDYGPHWSNAREVRRGEDELLTLLELPPEARADADRWVLPPGLLDQATWLFSPDALGDYLPMGYGRILVRDRLPARVWVHRRLRPGAEQAAEVRSDDFTIVDHAGRELVAVTDFVLRRVAGPTLRPQRTAAAERWISPAEGVAAFRRVVASPVGPHVLVAPHPFAAVAARVRREADQETGRRKPAVAESARPVPGAAGDQVPPREGLEATLAAIWGSVLGVADVAADDDFFSLGGNSLVAVQLIAQVRKAVGVRLPMRSLFDTPTVAGMAAKVAELRAAQAASAPPAPPAPPAVSAQSAEPAPATQSAEQATTIPRLSRSTP